MTTAPEHAQIEQICQEFMAISRRIERGVPPKPDQIRDRIAFLLDGVIDLLGVGAKAEIVTLVIGERAHEGFIHTSATSRIQEAMQLPDHAGLFEPLKLWCRETLITESLSQKHGGLRMFDPVTVANVIGDELATLFQTHGNQFADLDQLATYINDYEDNGPPHGLPVFYRDGSLREMLWMPSANLTDAQAAQWVLSEPPLEMISLGSKRARQIGGLQGVVDWIESDPFIDPITQVCFGGANGLRVAALVVLRLAYCASHIADGQLSVDTGFLHPGSFRPFGNLLIHRIVKMMNTSAVILAPTIEARSVSGIPEIPFHRLPDRATSASNSAIRDPAQSQENVRQDQYDIPSSQAETLNVEDSIEPESEAEKSEYRVTQGASRPAQVHASTTASQSGPFSSTQKPAPNVISSDEERAGIPASQKHFGNPSRTYDSDSQDEAQQAQEPPFKRTKVASSEMVGAKDSKKSFNIVIKQEKVAPSVKVRPKIKALPPKAGPNPDRAAIDVDAHMTDTDAPLTQGQIEPESGSDSPAPSVKSKGKGKARRSKTRESPAFETPAPSDPLFEKIGRAPPAGHSRRAASRAGSIKRVTRASSGK